MRIGFEAEFMTNVRSLTSDLRVKRLVGNSDIHHYHCDCDYCDVWEGYPLRVQSDSTCDGEVISKVQEDWDEAVELMTELQESAVAVDAEPGHSAGFHVHVDVEHLNSRLRDHVVQTFLLWEPALRVIAGGYADQMRDGGGNSSPREQLRWDVAEFLELETGEEFHGTQDQWHTLLRERRESSFPVYQWHRNHDRHNLLNVRTRHNTFEFRLWNSTRSAWRMELFARLSQAFCDEGFSSLAFHAPTVPVTRRTNRIPVLARVAREADFGRLAQLLDRQYQYLIDGHAHQGETFTCLVSA